MVNLVAKIWTPTLRYLPNMLNLTIFSFSRHECCLWTLKKFKKIMHDHCAHIMIHNLVTIPLHSFNFSLNPTLYQEETSFHWRKNPILTLIWENFHNAEGMSPLFHTQVINSKTNPPCFFLLSNRAILLSQMILYEYITWFTCHMTNVIDHLTQLTSPFWSAAGVFLVEIILKFLKENGRSTFLCRVFRCHGSNFGHCV